MFVSKQSSERKLITETYGNVLKLSYRRNHIKRRVRKVYGNYVMDFGGGAGGFFNHCVIDSKNRGTVYGGGGCVFTNCTFKQAPTAPVYNGYPFMTGNFYGTNHWEKYPYDYKYTIEGLANLASAKFYGPFYVNEVEVTGTKTKGK